MRPCTIKVTYLGVGTPDPITGEARVIMRMQLVEEDGRVSQTGVHDHMVIGSHFKFTGFYKPWAENTPEEQAAMLEAEKGTKQ